ncbi:MAG: hypothetical protein AAFU79_29645, partial [Myxococcota bacterium]
ARVGERRTPRWWLASLLVAGCATHRVDIDRRAEVPTSPQSIVLLPVVNASGAPLAGDRAEAILTTLLLSKGVEGLERYARPVDAGVPDLDDRRRYDEALASARASGLEIGITGTVVEWRYRPGLDDEPAVSISLRIVEVESGRVLWSGSGSRGARGTVGAVAQSLLSELVQAMPFGGG